MTGATRPKIARLVRFVAHAPHPGPLQHWYRLIIAGCQQVDDLLEHHGLVAEVEVHRLQRHVRGGGDLVQGGGRIALLGEQLARPSATAA
jgi:hypothetical protein